MNAHNKSRKDKIEKIELGGPNELEYCNLWVEGEAGDLKVNVAPIARKLNEIIDKLNNL